VRYALARNGEEALDFLFAKGDYRHRSTAAPPRLVLLDLNLPLMNGKIVLRAIKAHAQTHDIPVVMFTATDDGMEAALCRLMGAADCVCKSAQVGQYMDSIGKVCRHWLSSDDTGPISLAA
jgi:two-component system response regulator